MIKAIIILLCAFAVCYASIAVFLSTILFSKDITPIRVRTLEELSKRSNESVLDFVGLVEQYNGYTAEEYKVTTNDGYILGLHRISGSPSSPKAKEKPVVYIQHGLFGSSDFFVVLGPEQALAFQLADAGYDIWLGNLRGTTYSKSHTNYTTDNSTFWDFRMDEMGLNDVSKFIDVVLEKTGQKDLTYIGYSMGTTLSYILLSSKVEYNKKINLLISIAPVAYFTPPVSRTVSFAISTVLRATYVTNANEVLAQSVAIANFAKESCASEYGNPCKIFLRSFADVDHMNSSVIPTILAHAPAGTSYYTVKHYEQLTEYGSLRKYDYPCGLFSSWICNNYQVYKQEDAPIYNLTLISAPSAIFYSENDVFVKVEDAEKLNKTLENVVAFEKVSDKTFNHLDFAWSAKAKSLVYNRLLEVISENLNKKDENRQKEDDNLEKKEV